MTQTLREAAEKYGPKVRWCRQGARLSGRELCRRIGISPAYLSDIETGRRLPAPDVSDRIADAIGIDRDGLWRLALHERLSERDLRTLARSESPSPEGLDVALLTKALTEALSAMDDEWIVDECAEYAAAEYARLRSSADSGPEGT